MYFNDNKNNTNIDNEFNDKKNVLITIKDILNKYKILIFIGIILILSVVVIILFSNPKTNNYLILHGEENITIYQSNDYIEPGYEAYNSKNEDLTHKVKIESTLDTDKIGIYEITYTIGKTTKTRKINVVEKPTEYIYIYLKTVNNDVNIYLKVGEKYEEPGYQIFSSTGKNLTDEVTITGSVDTLKEGSYKLIYSVVDSNNVTISATRTVIVMDTKINLSLNTNSYVNNEITINVNVIDNYFDYIILPDKTKVTDNNYSYKVSENGEYSFTTYNKKGLTKTSSIKVNNINKTAPTGTCSGYYKDGKSYIEVTSSDDIGIDRYVIENASYTNNKITVNKEMTKANITIYDKAGNFKNISCNLEDENKIMTSDKSITFSYKYVSDGKNMPYALYTPSTANNSKKGIPLIVWLHGSGETRSSEGLFKVRGLLKVLDDWKLEGFNAYILCPHLTGIASSSSWTGKTTQNYLYTLIDNFIKENNIDTNRIILMGHSLGGIGVLYTAYQRPNFYSALVVMSGYDPGVDISTLKHIPTRGYSESISFMNNKFKNTFGSENYYQLSTSHGNVPNMALNIDENNDNKSDLVEWMLAQEKK